MIARVLIVVLAVLNLGAGLWWALHRPAPADAVVAASPGVARLQLWREAGAAAAAPVPEAAPAAPDLAAPAAMHTVPAPAALPDPAVAEAPARAVVPHCYSYGPYPDRAAAQAARARLGRLERSALRELPVPAAPGTSYRVFLPAAADDAAVEASVRKLTAAGSGDYYEIRGAENANGIALGLYRKRDGAEARLAELQRAGIRARIETQGAPASQWWLDAAFAGDAPAAEAARRQALDCAGMR